jgi:DNA-binding NtrC family response regulator
MQDGGAASPSPVSVPALTILYHPQLDRVGSQAVLHELCSGESIQLSRAAPEFSSRVRPTAEPLADRNLSRGPLRLAPIDGGGVRLDIGDCRSRVVVGGEVLRGAVELDQHALNRGVVLELAGRIVLLIHHVASATSTASVFATLPDDPVGVELSGESFAMHRLRQDIRRVADLDIPVLIRGETGSGKELVARAIHRASPRRAAPFIAVNLAAIPGSLASSELFGADQGAYTGAVKRQPGYFMQAQGGTLFLDEIGEASPEIQVALLRVLETSEIQPVGAQRPTKVDVRVIAATDADIEGKITGKEFRAPLFHRLAAYEIWAPPLRERRDDIGRLLARFFAEECARVGEADHLQSPPETGELWLPASLVARLADYDWPGNVRQLRNVVRQLIVGNRGRGRVECVPSVERLLQTGARPCPSRSAVPPPAALPGSSADPEAELTRTSAGNERISSIQLRAPADRRKPAAVSEEELAEALSTTRWDLSAAAGLLRISRTSLYALIEGNPRFRTAGSVSAEEIARAYHECHGDIDCMVERLEVSERALRRRMRELGLGAQSLWDESKK